MTDRLLTYTDAGAVAGVSRSTIAKWVDEGYLAAVAMPGSTRKRIPEGNLIRMLRSLATETQGTQVSSNFASSEKR